MIDNNKAAADWFTPEKIDELRKAKAGVWIFGDAKRALDAIEYLQRQLAELREGIDPKERKPDYGVVVHAHIGSRYYDRVFLKDDFPHLDEWSSDTKPCVTYATIDRWWHLPEVGE